jgi:hypothetical protein
VFEQRGCLVTGGKERLADGGGIEAEQEEIELLEKIAGGGAQDRADARLDLGRIGCWSSHDVSPLEGAAGPELISRKASDCRLRQSVLPLSRGARRVNRFHRGS